MPYDTIINDIKNLPKESYPELSEYISFLTYKFSDSTKSSPSHRGKRKVGGLSGSLKYMADDFDAPLDDFKEYM